VEVLVDALAAFGSTRRASLIESGQPVTRRVDLLRSPQGWVVTEVYAR
jgi:hypothetical protein